MKKRTVIATILAATLAATINITALAAEKADNSKEIAAMSQWLDGLTVTPSEGTPAGLVPTEMTDKELAAYADSIFELVNKERKKAGAEPLERSEYLDDAANIRAEDCASMNSIRYNGKAHTRPDGSRWFTVLGIEKNYNYGENAGQGKFAADAQMKSWMDSKGHRTNILYDRYTEIGIGCAISEQGQIYAIQIFYRP